MDDTGAGSEIQKGVDRAALRSRSESSVNPDVEAAQRRDTHSAARPIDNLQFKDPAENASVS